MRSHDIDEKAGLLRDPLGFSAIILAGGRSQRMGRGKASLTLGARTLLEIAIERGRRLAGEVIVVSSRTPRLPDASIRLVPDAERDCGPLMGLLSGLLACRGPRAFALAADMPFVPVGLLASMARRSGPYDAVLLCWRGRVEPLCGIYSKRIIPVLEACVARGERSFRDFLGRRRLRVAYLGEEFLRSWGDPAALLHNVNTPTDYVQARRIYLRARPSTAERPRRRADRVSPETAAPPVLGKEISHAGRHPRAGHRLPPDLSHRPL